MMVETEDMQNPNHQFYKEQLLWQDERYESAQNRAKVAWMIAYFCLGLVGLMVIVLMLLVPLKTVEPHVVTVDKQTGETTISHPLRDDKVLSQMEVLQKYFITKYVLARAGYDYMGFRNNYNAVRLMSTKEQFARYNAEASPENPESLYVKYGDRAKLRVTVKSISFLPSDPNTATVRINKWYETNNGAEEAKPFVVTMSFRYTLQPQTEADRQINPLGFQATDWREDAEVAGGL